MITIKILLIIIAAIAKAVADTIHHHPRTMVFKGKFWKMWPHDNGYYPLTKIPKDGWHTFNGIMICSLIAIPFVDYFAVYHWVIVIGAYVVTGYIVWILPFNLFYHKILQKKTSK